jgi:hypothetical protein
VIPNAGRDQYVQAADPCNTTPPHRDRADPGLDLALGAMPVPHQALPPVRQRHTLHRRQERPGFRLNRLSQQPAGAAP